MRLGMLTNLKSTTFNNKKTAYKSTTFNFFQLTINNWYKEMYDLQIYNFWTLKVVDSTTQNNPNLQPTINDLPLLGQPTRP